VEKGWYSWGPWQSRASWLLVPRPWASADLRDTARAMSEENVEIVRRVFDAVARRDTETILSHPDVDWDGSRHRWAEMLGGTAAHWQGHEGLRRWSREYYAMWENLEDEVEELLDAGDCVVSIVTTRARGRASGIEVEWKQNAGVWTVREGKVVQVVWHATPEDALEAAGLSESDG
jgi:ketosteroid isomerase-like protein